MKLKIDGTSFSQEGPLLFTHFGLSGPAVLKLSAWGAKGLHERNYNTPIVIDWLPEENRSQTEKKLLEMKKTNRSIEYWFRLSLLFS